MLDEYDRFGQVFTISVSAFGIVANSLLLFAIRTRSTHSFRTYSTILFNTAIVDLIASATAALTVSRLVSSPATVTTFLIFTGPCSYAGRIVCWIGHAIETQMWMSSNYFLCFAFAYRLLSIRKRELSRNMVLLITIANHLANCAVAAALFCLFLDNDCTFDDIIAARPAFLSILETNYQFAAVQFHTVRSVIDLAFIVSSSPVVFLCTFVLRHLTVHTLRRSRNSMSSSTLDLHRMLVRTLNFQLALTTLMGIFLLNLFGIVDHPLAEIMICATVNLLPAISPIINFICIRPYRLFIMRLLGLKSTLTNASITGVGMSMTIPG